MDNTIKKRPDTLLLYDARMETSTNMPFPLDSQQERGRAEYSHSLHPCSVVLDKEEHLRNTLLSLDDSTLQCDVQWKECIY